MNNNAIYYKTFSLLAFAIITISFVFTPTSYSQNTKKLKEKEQEVREYMQEISRQLGVTCNACHNPDNFKEDKKIEFKIAKEHIRVVELLNKDGFRGTPRVDCYMCHRGQMKPDYKEKKKVF